MADVHQCGVLKRRRRCHLHDRLLQDAGSCCCSLLSHGRQLPWVLFQTQWIPGQAWLQDAGLEKAKQLGEVYVRTSLSRRLLKPPNTYITLRDRKKEVLEVQSSTFCAQREPEELWSECSSSQVC